MLFTSGIFWLFFLAVFLSLLANSKFVKSVKLQNAIILFSSYYFYANWDWRFLSLIILSTLIDYTAAIKIESATNPRIRKAYLWFSIGTNLGILGVFKYFGFFAAELSEAFKYLGLTPSWATLNIILPVGISFYTFQTITYTADVYLKRMNSDKDLIKYAAYVAFFPQLVAGPIERARNLLPQFSLVKETNWDRLYQGIFLIIFGLFLKVVVADSLSPLVDKIFAGSSHYSGFVLLLGSVFFGVQIYGDFCGYSTIAIGVATILGFDLMTNFRTPYFATSVQEFWRCWHISLSTFFRDYLFIPLGGSRGSEARTARNLMITFLASGLWHGANWTFLVWGGVHGLLLIAERQMGRLLHRFPIPRLTILCRAYTLSAVTICWVFFRSSDLPTATEILRKIIWEFSIPNAAEGIVILYHFGSGISVVFLTLLVDLLWRNDVRLETGLPFVSLQVKRGWFAESMTISAMFTLVVACFYLNGADNAFVYFQF